MKKILLLAAFFIVTGTFTSCTKEKDVTPTGISKSIADNGGSDKNTLGNGDGSRP